MAINTNISYDGSAKHVYQAPIPFMATFYAILLAWSAICIRLIIVISGPKGTAGVLPLFMISFILCYMWYFSLGISYRLEIGDNGEIRLVSPRRTLRVHVEGITVIELPRAGLGFVRFRLKREKAYLFALMQNTVLKTALAAIENANSYLIMKRR
jgi:hypothetical protein